ncbi:peroxiredoxin Dot5p [[Candida] railenensis]|uniref:thioredoxin-dependent peroxiredoxin n=1 Tax=[Candida] railenensis TaxID=45579 RepID=A0A9P0VZH0_9ASCO|nr:peroxiredoxin Dot5p [[Candida] railenensis]
MPELRRSTRVASRTKEENSAPAAKATVEPPLKKKKSEGKPATPKKVDAVVAASTAADADDAVATVSEPKKEKTAKIEELEIGDKIPDWFFVDQDEKEIHLAKLDKPIVVIFSYPKASTPGCTRQACGFRDNYNGLKSKAVVLGLSADSPKAQKSFATKHGFQYSLLSDPSKKLLQALGGLKAERKIIRSHWIFVDNVLKVKAIGVSPEVSYTTAKESVEKFASA